MQRKYLSIAHCIAMQIMGLSNRLKDKMWVGSPGQSQSTVTMRLPGLLVVNINNVNVFQRETGRDLTYLVYNRIRKAVNGCKYQDDATKKVDKRTYDGPLA